MSITGKNTKSIRKKDVKESKSLSSGFVKLTFAHEASAGETGINLGSLVTPASWTSQGNTQPSTQRLLEAKLFQFKDNLKIVSSLRGELMKISYRVSSNSQITFNGFAAEEGEIFEGTIDSNPVSGIQVIDAKQPVADGDLADGDTDFPIGFTTRTNADQIVVFRNGLEQKRNSNNSSTVTDGNYYVVDNGSGYGSLIRFNVAASGSNDYVKVTAIGGVVESPTNSTWDELEKVQGQIDAIVPTVSALAGVPETDFQAAPNNVDLRQFGAVLNGLLDVRVPIVSDWVSFTPTGTWTNTTYSGRWRQVLDHYEIEYEIDITGAPAGGIQDLSIPVGENIDFTGLAYSDIGISVGWGTSTANAQSSGFNIYGYINSGFGDIVRLRAERIDVNGPNGEETPREDNLGSGGYEMNSVSNNWNSNDKISLKVTIPIQGLNSHQTLKEHLEDKGIL